MSEGTYRLPDFYCPTCGVQLDATSVMPGQEQVRPPHDGDYSCCAECSEWAIFQVGTFGVNLRACTPQERAELETQYGHYTQAVRQISRERGHPN